MNLKPTYPVWTKESWWSNPPDFLCDLSHSFDRVEGAGGKVDEATGGPSHKADHALPDPLEEAAHAVFHGALVGLEADPGDAFEDAHDDALAASRQALAKVLPAALFDGFASLPLEIFVKGQ